MIYKSHFMYSFFCTDVVIAAIKWLKQNNHLYSDVEINDNWADEWLNPYPADQIFKPFQPLPRLTKMLLSIFIHSLPNATNVTDLHFSCSYCQQPQ